MRFARPFIFISFFFLALFSEGVEAKSRHDLRLNTRFYETKSKREIQLPGKRGYSFEVVKAEGEFVYLKLFDPRGKEVEGNFRVLSRYLDDVVKKEITDALQTTAKGAQSGEESCCDVVDDGADIPEAQARAQSAKAGPELRSISAQGSEDREPGEEDVRATAVAREEVPGIIPSDKIPVPTRRPERKPALESAYQSPHIPLDKIPVPTRRPDYKPPQKEPRAHAKLPVDGIPVPTPRPRREQARGRKPASGICAKYQEFLDQGVPEAPLKQALLYYSTEPNDQRENRQLSNTRYVSIADYSKNSSQERFYLLDMETGRVTKRRVSHGAGVKKYGKRGDPNHDGYLDRCFDGNRDLNARQRDRERGMTRSGFFKVTNFYNSSSGRYSGWPWLKKNERPPKNGMRMIGLTPEANWDAEADGVVMHEAEYNPRGGGKMGRSHGCPAFAPSEGVSILDRIQGGSLFYSYTPMCKDQMRATILQVHGWENFCE